MLMARTVGGLEELDDSIRAEGGKATLIPQDLLNLEALDTLGPALAEKFGGLDIFVGNAAMLGTLGPMTHMKAKEWDDVQRLNLTANVRLIRTLGPLLQASDAGRIILTTSGLAQSPLAYWAAYCTSKAALEMMAKSYAAEVEKTNLRVNLIDPGVVDTAMIREAFPGGYQGDLAKPEDIVPAFMALAAEDCHKHGEVITAKSFSCL